ncbi:hypothetical protein PG991_012959 [Apiospora marii]|uniref:Hydroxyproline-rich glyco protein n=1 Tax=Apiospora marii TaxID=335849 RepID=A0ABR1RBI3_9PEZI
MDGPAASVDGETPSEPSPQAAAAKQLPKVVDIAKAGDLILDVTFENSKATVKAARKRQQQQASSLKTHPNGGQSSAAGTGPPPKSKLRLGFRVDAGVLRRQSQYFDRLLSDTRFQEAKTIAAALEALTLRNVKPADADVSDLPWIQVIDDDDATHYAYRDNVFSDLLRLLHGKETAAAAAAIAAAATAAPATTTTAGASKTTPAAPAAPATPATPPPTLDFWTALAILADRFDCAAPVAKALKAAGGLRIKWPVTQRKQPPSGNGEEAKMSRQTESVLRQKILVSYLLDQPPRFLAATRELIMNGSCKWSAFPDPNEAAEEEASWWYLPDELEQELQYRRECILNTLASIPRHFLALYSSRTRQCKLGYDSSAACDSYQLGEMIKFFVNKHLLFLVDFSPGSLDRIADTALTPVDGLLAALKQVPSYQIDTHHRNCGLRTRILPVLEFVTALLSANSVPVARPAWHQRTKNQATSSTVAWFSHAGVAAAAAAEDKRIKFESSGGDGEDGDSSPPGTFRFTRAVASDPRLRFEHALGADQFARDVFTAPAWNWTADQDAPPITSGFGRTPNLRMMYR